MAEANDRSVAVGMSLARQVFEKRGNHSEAHLKESEIAAIVALGIELSGQPDLYAVVQGVDDEVSKGEPCSWCSTSPHRDDCSLVAALKKARGEA